MGAVVLEHSSHTFSTERVRQCTGYPQYQPNQRAASMVDGRCLPVHLAACTVAPGARVLWLYSPTQGLALLPRWGGVCHRGVQSSLRAPSLRGPLAAFLSARLASSSFFLSSRLFLDSSALLRPAETSTTEHIN